VTSETARRNCARSRTGASPHMSGIWKDWKEKTPNRTNRHILRADHAVFAPPSPRSIVSRDFSTDYAVIVVNYGDPALISDNAGHHHELNDGGLFVVVDNFHSDGVRARVKDLCRERGWLFVPS